MQILADTHERLFTLPLSFTLSFLLLLFIEFGVLAKSVQTPRKSLSKGARRKTHAAKWEVRRTRHGSWRILTLRESFARSLQGAWRPLGQRQACLARIALSVVGLLPVLSFALAYPLVVALFHLFLEPALALVLVLVVTLGAGRARTVVRAHKVRLKQE